LLYQSELALGFVIWACIRICNRSLH
jgi:hypothetical protein